MLNEMKQLIVPGILVLGNKKEVRILNSNNLLDSVIRILPQLQDEAILEIIHDGDPTNRSIMVCVLAKKYENAGFKVVTMVPKWSCRIRVHNTIPTPKKGFTGQYRLLVEVYNSYQTIVVGVFATRDEAEEFVNSYYKDGVNGLIYCTNQETKEYYEMSDLPKKISRID